MVNIKCKPQLTVITTFKQIGSAGAYFVCALLGIVYALVFVAGSAV